MSVGITTTRVVEDVKLPRLLMRKLKLEVIDGPDRGKKEIFGLEEINVGTQPDNEFVLADSAVSRYHLRIALAIRGFAINDLESTNGTFVGSLRLGQVTFIEATDVRLGETTLRLSPLNEEAESPLHPQESIGRLAGRSPQMRSLFAKLPTMAAAESTILIEGETGTGKELVAEEIHRLSSRHDRPFIIVDCGAIPEHLVESELFGHLRGAFTDAATNRVGAFELADGGTLFLDEIGELPASAQPKLLRALENRQIKPIGAGKYHPINVRIIAATNRDLRLAVNQGTFRADLFYRLSVLRVRLPPLRERLEDIELLASLFLQESARQHRLKDPSLATLNPQTLQRLMQHRWPGNVRELRNFMERVLLLVADGQGQLPEFDPSSTENATSNASPVAEDVRVDLPYKDAKMRWVDLFEVAYVQALLSQNNGNVAAAARAAGVDRTYIFRLIRKYDLKK